MDSPLPVAEECSEISEMCKNLIQLINNRESVEKIERLSELVSEACLEIRRAKTTFTLRLLCDDDAAFLKQLLTAIEVNKEPQFYFLNRMLALF